MWFMLASLGLVKSMKSSRSTQLSIGALSLLVAPLLACTAADDRPRHTMIVVAHQDDDLSMVSDMRARFAAHEPIYTVYLTNGDADSGCGDYVRDREEGIRNAYASLAGVPEAPLCTRPAQTDCWNTQLTLLDMRFHALVGREIYLLFAGLPNPPVSESEPGLHPTLERLWTIPDATLSTQLHDGRTQNTVYTKESLIHALSVIIDTVGATDFHTLNPERSAGVRLDHTDHSYAAHFGLAAAQRATMTPTVTLHRGYDAVFAKGENRQGQELADYTALFDVYRANDPMVCGESTPSYCPSPHNDACEGFCARIPTECVPMDIYNLLMPYRSSIHPVSALRQSIGAPEGRCLDIDDGSRVISTACNGSTKQAWLLDAARGSIRSASTGQCMELLDGGVIGLSDCSASNTAQRFYLFDDGRLRGPDATCATADPSSDRMTSVQCDFSIDQGDFALSN